MKEFHEHRLEKKDPTGIKNCKKGIVCFIIVGLQESILYVIESCTKIKIKVAYLKDELTECFDVLYQCSFMYVQLFTIIISLMYHRLQITEEMQSKPRQFMHELSIKQAMSLL